MRRATDAETPSSDHPRFEREVVGHLDALYALALRLTRSPSEGEDLVQDTVLKAIRARDQFEPGTNMRAWLLRILTNAFINRYRRTGLERTVLDGPDGDPLADGWISSATLEAMRDPESLALRPVLEAEIREALDALPADFRLVVLLSDVEELSYKEIADIVGCPIGTVMSRLHRGRRLLKAQLLEHARALGIVTAAPKVGQNPVDLEDYRRKRASRS
ncbi:MAG: sigma-70 family RNA polymerase sigma factor [Polyangiaceae bacterium]|nr:sigma-70 family RNA polymerase sigma factor [Polyangiaceae bacterium]